MGQEVVGVLDEVVPRPLMYGEQVLLYFVKGAGVYLMKGNMCCSWSQLKLQIFACWCNAGVEASNEDEGGRPVQQASRPSGTWSPGENCCSRLFGSFSTDQSNSFDLKIP